MPSSHYGLGMVTSPTGKGVIVMQGNDIFELSDSMVWTKLKQTLQINHSRILVIPISKELVYEKIKETKQE